MGCIPTISRSGESFREVGFPPIDHPIHAPDHINAALLRIESPPLGIPFYSMSPATPTLRIFAASLIGYEAQVNPPSQADLPTALPVTEKLRPVIANYVGRSGYHALIYRTLMLARDEVPWLREVVIDADGSLENFADLAASQDSADATAGSEVLLARLIELLVAFIGELLTLRLVHGLWPVLPNDPHFTQENLS